METVPSPKIFEITDKAQKSLVCDRILRQLPSWFGIEEAIVEYTDMVQNQLFFALGNSDSNETEKASGFIAIEFHYHHSAEIHVMGVIPSKHRSGSGRTLVERAEDACRKRGVRFLTVKTLSPSRESSDYAKTRKFYEAIGFEPLEEFKTLWGEANPGLYMIKVL